MYLNSVNRWTTITGALLDFVTYAPVIFSFEYCDFNPYSKRSFSLRRVLNTDNVIMRRHPFRGDPGPPRSGPDYARMIIFSLFFIAGHTPSGNTNNRRVMFEGQQKKKIGKVYAHRSTNSWRGRRRRLLNRNCKRFSLGVRSAYQIFIVLAVAVFYVYVARVNIGGYKNLLANARRRRNRLVLLKVKPNLCWKRNGPNDFKPSILHVFSDEIKKSVG